MIIDGRMTTDGVRGDDLQNSRVNAVIAWQYRWGGGQQVDSLLGTEYPFPSH